MKCWIKKGEKQTLLAVQLKQSCNMLNCYWKIQQLPRFEVLFDIIEILRVKQIELRKEKK
jgi:hypothetical protein